MNISTLTCSTFSRTECSYSPNSLAEAVCRNECRGGGEGSRTSGLMLRLTVCQRGGHRAAEQKQEQRGPSVQGGHCQVTCRHHVPGWHCSLLSHTSHSDRIKDEHLGEETHAEQQYEKHHSSHSQYICIHFEWAYAHNAKPAMTKEGVDLNQSKLISCILGKQQRTPSELFGRDQRCSECWQQNHASGRKEIQERRV